MKNLWLLALISILLSACGKDETGLEGRWNWTESTGGIAGTTHTPETEDEERQLRIDENTIEWYVEGELSSSNTFTVEERESIFGGEKPMIILDQGAFNYSFEVDEEQLIMNEEVYDGFAHSYKRD